MIFIEEKVKEEYTTANSTIYFFSKDGKKFTSFSVWVNGDGLIVKAPDKFKTMLNEPIGLVMDRYKNKGWSCEAIV